LRTREDAKRRAPDRAELPKKFFRDKKALDAWLEKNHGKSPGLWLQIAKKDSGRKSVSYPEALESVLCYGWIDGQKKPESEATWLQKITPRAKRSMWSQVNCQKAKGLIAAGLMRPAGLAEIERAKTDGRWENAYESFSSATVPPDFEKALKKSPRAHAAFNTLTRTLKYSVLWNIHAAKKPETRERRVRNFVERLEKKGTPR
jgi:uncharacterized protein YdeI (YjbR/CyaY-like superfamily)